MSYKAIYIAERQSIRRARQLNFGRTIAIVLRKPFGQTILDCLGRMHSARQFKIVLQASSRSDNLIVLADVISFGKTKILSWQRALGQTITEDCLGR